ncbi:MAG: class I SAM-dependent methyltransferase [Verrucomicrobiota bacterium]
MNQATHNTGNGGYGQPLRQLDKIAPGETASSLSDVKKSLVTFQTAEGLEMQGVPAHVTRYVVAFELYNPNVVPRLSEVLNEFKIILQDRTIYSGRSVVRNVVDVGSAVVCEVTLDETHWMEVEAGLNMTHNGQLVKEFNTFLNEWQKFYKVRSEFKVVIADMQTFLTDLRLWLDQVELQIRASPSAAWAQLERRVIDSLAEPAIRGIDAFIDRFEAIAAGLEVELQPAHRAYLRRQLHPLVLSSPFAYRAFHKPLGYAGDYQLVDMMVRAPYEGGTLFAKIMNVWLLGQLPSQAHRNRVAYLERKLLEETARVNGQGRTARIFNLGCGPAAEVQRFFAEERISERADLTLLDFNQETLQHLHKALREIEHKLSRRLSVRLVKKSVYQILREAGRTARRGSENQYDFIYCAGLFDYLSDNVCKQLMNIFYEMLGPGGLLLATNVNDALNISRPFRYSMEYILDWHLIYRSRNRVAALAPEGAVADDVVVKAEDTGTNVFLEVRKPSHA